MAVDAGERAQQRARLPSRWRHFDSIGPQLPHQRYEDRGLGRTAQPRLSHE